MLNAFTVGLGSPTYQSWILISALFLVGFGHPPYASTTMRIQFTNIKAAQGSIYLAVYDQADKFLDEQEVRYQQIIQVSARGSLEIVVSDLPAGNYAISCFHDVNGNGKMDKNFLGIPTDLRVLQQCAAYFSGA